MKKIILTDIEGTTSSICFVKDVLFPYARRALPQFVRQHGDEPDVRHWLDAVAREVGGISNDDTLIEVLQGWIDSDRKHPALKALQGMIWESGYQQGEYVAHVYSDAVTGLQAWHAEKHLIFVYSSGSVAAQKLLFEHNTAGDLRPLFSGYFDTRMGGKQDSQSYRNILAALNAAGHQVVFLSDVVAELDAAREAGLDTILLDRLEDYPTPRLGQAGHDHVRVTSFAEIHL